jgi:flagellar hook-length control protein FliK
MVISNPMQIEAKNARIDAPMGVATAVQNDRQPDPGRFPGLATTQDNARSFDQTPSQADNSRVQAMVNPALTALTASTILPPSTVATGPASLPDNPSMAASTILAASSPQPNTPPPGLVYVGTPVTTSGFPDALGHHLVLLSRTGQQAAQLVLNPAHLGPIQVAIQMNGNQANLAIQAPHETTRSLIQDALPQLQTMFQQSGLQLTNAHVGHGDGGASDPSPGARQLRIATGKPNDDQGPLPAITSVPRPIGLIDTFA